MAASIDAAEETAIRSSFLFVTPILLMRILCLGDSYTIGESVAASERWPVQLVHALRAGGRQVEDAEMIAQTGWTTDELDQAIDQAKPQGPYDLVTLLIGVNNQYRGRAKQEYRDQFRHLLVRAVGFAGNRPGHVVVISIPDWGVTPFANGRDRASIAREIDAFNANNSAEAARAGVRYVDITPISREAARTPTLTAKDGLHPSGEMYRRWVEEIQVASGTDDRR
jgi:lysophospholipase L1-like esterase